MATLKTLLAVLVSLGLSVAGFYSATSLPATGMAGTQIVQSLFGDAADPCGNASPAVQLGAQTNASGKALTNAPAQVSVDANARTNAAGNTNAALNGVVNTDGTILGIDVTGGLNPADPASANTNVNVDVSANAPSDSQTRPAVSDAADIDRMATGASACDEASSPSGTMQVNADAGVSGEANTNGLTTAGQNAQNASGNGNAGAVLNGAVDRGTTLGRNILTALTNQINRALNLTNNAQSNAPRSIDAGVNASANAQQDSQTSPAASEGFNVNVDAQQDSQTSPAIFGGTDTNLITTLLGTIK